MRLTDLDPAIRPRTLYVSRPLLNGDALREWARSQGLPNMIPVSDLHVTLAHSVEPVAWEGVPRVGGPITCQGGPRLVQPLGDKGAVVLRFEDDALQDRWKGLCDAGCQWRWPSYKPHVTLTYAGAGWNLSGIQPYEGALEFGPERFAEIDDNWSAEITEERLD